MVYLTHVGFHIGLYVCKHTFKAYLSTSSNFSLQVIDVGACATWLIRRKL